MSSPVPSGIPQMGPIRPQFWLPSAPLASWTHYNWRKTDRASGIDPIPRHQPNGACDAAGLAYSAIHAVGLYHLPWHRRIDDEAAEVARMLGMANGHPDLRELLDRVADLLIENAAIGHHNHGIEYLAGLMRETNKLMRQPGYRVRLA
jgi:hypothetical protein